MQKGDPAVSIPEGVAALISILQSKAKGPMPAPALIPASVVLMCEAFDFLASAGKVQVTKELVGEAASNLIGFMAQKLGVNSNTVTQSKLQMARQKQQQGAQQPAPQQPQGQPPAGSM